MSISQNLNPQDVTYTGQLDALESPDASHQSLHKECQKPVNMCFSANVMHIGKLNNLSDLCN